MSMSVFSSWMSVRTGLIYMTFGIDSGIWPRVEELKRPKRYSVRVYTHTQGGNNLIASKYQEEETKTIHKNS